jgi:hypothetical protein
MPLQNLLGVLVNLAHAHHSHSSALKAQIETTDTAE